MAGPSISEIRVTLILAVANKREATMVADRRLSWKGNSLPEEAQKSGIVYCDDARLLFGFTGLATIGAMNTHQWIQSTLVKLRNPNSRARDFLERFGAALTKDWGQSPAVSALPAADRRLSVFFFGYHYQPIGRPRIVAAAFSNFQDFHAGTDSAEASSEFLSLMERDAVAEDGEPTYVQRMGAWQAIDESLCEDLRRRAAQSSREAVLGKAISLTQSVAESLRFCGIVSKSAMATVLPSEIREKPLVQYIASAPSTETHFPAEVFCFSGQPGLAVSMMVQADDPDGGPILSTPVVGRNKRCPCGSGKKYKRCHGTVTII